MEIHPHIPPPANADAGPALPVELTRAAEAFEASFISQMLKAMPLGQGAGPYSDILVDEYGKLMARSGGIGVADAIARELLSIQEMNP
jgi:peptidoglycan hydrolase FlgJ